MIAQELQSLGHEVHVFDFAKRNAHAYVGVGNPRIAADIERLKSGISGFHLLNSPVSSEFKYVMGAPELRRVAREVRADTVMALYGGGFGLMAYLSGVRPYGVYVVGSDVLKAGSMRRVINGIVLGHAAKVFANGEYLAEQTRLQAPNADIIELLIGVDVEAFKVSSFPEGPFQFICSRGFTPIYNNEAIIEAIARFPEDTPDFRMVFVSGGPGLNDAKALADNLLPPKMRERVIFWGGVSYDELTSGLSSSHAFVSMSRSDGTATSLLEAMATGLYPILSDIPQNRPWVSKDLKNGTLVPLDDADLLAGAMLDVLRDRQSCVRLAEVNRGVIEERANARVNRRELARHLVEAVESHGRSRR